MLVSVAVDTAVLSLICVLMIGEYTNSDGCSSRIAGVGETGAAAPYEALCASEAGGGSCS